MKNCGDLLLEVGLLLSQQQLMGVKMKVDCWYRLVGLLYGGKPRRARQRRGGKGKVKCSEVDGSPVSLVVPADDGDVEGMELKDLVQGVRLCELLVNICI
jgi:hypothetical protein